MKVLQLGESNWASQYKLPQDMDWYFNDFNLDTKIKRYDVVIVTGKTKLDEKLLNKLLTMVSPYHVLYSKSIYTELNESERAFLKSMIAQRIKEDPQELINKLLLRYFFGQHGTRFLPETIKLNERVVTSYEFLDRGHLKLDIDTEDEWVNIGSYRNSVYLDTGKLIDLWLSLENQGVEVRLNAFVRTFSDASNKISKQVISLTNHDEKEYRIEINPDETIRAADVSIEAKGKGKLIIGVLHSRWGRDGVGNFVAGGKRIINPKNREDIGYYFYPGDLRPPLNVYFSGARDVEAFEGLGLFRRLNAPMLLFTDMRLEMGEFYADSDKFFEKQIINKIKEKLSELGFDESQLTMNAISMGTYPALMCGAKLGAHSINLANPVINLGYCGNRLALERPDDFKLVLDVDHDILGSINKEKLEKMDQDFWDEFNRQDLSNTKLFVSHMLNDDYDDKAVEKLNKSNAVKNALQFSSKGFPGKHLEGPGARQWFIDRLNQILANDFDRKLE